jgi:hypothetical protein
MLDGPPGRQPVPEAGRYTPPGALAVPPPLAVPPLPPMFGHLCFVPVRPGADGRADGDEAATGCDPAVPVCALVEALAMVRPRARLAPRAPAPTAVPMSGRVILMSFSFASPEGRAAGARADQ